jgi:hypothetical protein
MLIHKNLILKTIDVVDRMEQTDIIEIVREGQLNKYQFIYDEFYEEFELVCITEEDAIWNDGYESFNDLQEDLVRSAVKGDFEDIGICK